MSRIIELIDDKTKMKIYRLTKQLIDEQKDLTIIQAMKHDSYKRINGRVRQVGWGEH